MSKPRPVNLNLWTIRFPITAIVSILHRISGVIIFFSLPLLLYVFDRSLKSVETFQSLTTCLDKPMWKSVLIATLVATSFHFYAGIRHMIMDLGFGETLCAAKMSAYILFILTIATSIAIGIWLW